MQSARCNDIIGEIYGGTLEYNSTVSMGYSERAEFGRVQYRGTEHSGIESPGIFAPVVSSTVFRKQSLRKIKIDCEYLEILYV
jgi:hypothetical protein